LAIGFSDRFVDLHNSERCGQFWVSVGRSQKKAKYKGIGEVGLRGGGWVVFGFFGVGLGFVRVVLCGMFFFLSFYSNPFY
jgi:hypothetical protein